jgi:hypothetical protein
MRGRSFFLLLLCLPLAAQAESVTIAGKTIQLVIPAGYCQLTKEKDAAFMRAAISSFDINNEVLAIFAACGELDGFRRGSRDALDNFGQILAQKTKKGAFMPIAGVSRQRFITNITGRSFESMDINRMNQEISARYRNAFNSEALASEAQRPYLLGADNNGAYFGVQSRLVEMSGKRSNLFGVVGITLINELSLTINIYEKFKGETPINGVLERHKKAVAALVAANS